MKDAFDDRRQALEDEFFHRVDEKLLKAMRAKTAAESSRKQLEAETGITDTELLDELLAAGTSAKSVAAISLVPLVLVAWADGKVESEEREQILQSARDQGIAIDTPAATLLEHWLSSKPKRQLGETWKHFITAVISQMGVESRKTLRNDLIARATAVARASGGVLGFGKISSEQRRVLSELEATLTL